MKYISIILLGIVINTNAQDPLFNNAHQSKIALNPSFAGTNGLLRYQSNMRSQWYNLSSSYLTFYNSMDVYLKPINGGIALSYTRDDISKGTLVTDRIDLTYAQHLKFFDKKLKIIPSIQISCFKKTLDNSKLNYGDQFDPRRGFAWSQAPSYQGKSTKTNIDLSAGLIINYKHLYIGSSLFHITQPDEGIMGASKLPFRSSSFISYNLELAENVLLNAIVRNEIQNNYYSIQLTINALLFKHLVISSGFRDYYTLNTNIGFRHNYFTVSGGYELSLNKSGPNTAGSYQIAASFNLRNKDDRNLVKDFERW